MTLRKLCGLAVILTSMQACIKDAPVNPEADIESFTIDKNALTGDVFIDQTKGRIRLYLTDEAYTSGVLPAIKVSAGASVTPASGDSLKFGSKGAKQYVVTSANGVNKKTYIIEVVNGSWKFDFEKWAIQYPQIPFENPVEEDGSQFWTSGNLGVGFAGITETKQFPLRSTTDAYHGKLAAELETKAGTAMSASMGINLFAGSMFLGNFDLGAALTNPLTATQFGQPYQGIPSRFTGYYKYKPGAVFQGRDGKPEAGMTDSCSIYAVLYEGTERLDATNILTSDRVLATAILKDGSAKADWTLFDIPFTERKTIDPSAKMMLAIITSSSKYGDFYRGAPGSRLVLDSIEIVH